MEENKYLLVKNWFLTIGKLPTIKDLHVQAENTEYLPVGKHAYKLPDDENLKKILVEWSEEQKPVLQKAIFLDDHYAISPLIIDGNYIYFISTFRE